jgi:hypothetical protein
MSDRWRRALEAAYERLLELDGIQIEIGEDGSIALAHIPSVSRAGLTHLTNGTCTCEAGQRDGVCWHRAAKRLLGRCWDAEHATQAHRDLTLEDVRRLGAAILQPEQPQTRPQPQTQPTHRDGTPKTMTYDQAMREMAELFPD